MKKLALRIGHRGLAAFAPENTLGGIRCAAAAGLSWVEVDVRVCKSGEAVLSHDADLRRCCGVSAQIKSTTISRLSAVSASAGFAGYEQEHVPLLKDALILAKQLKLSVVLELKPDKGGEKRAVNALAAALPSGGRNILISSFSEPILLAAKKLLPHIPRAFNCNRPDKKVFLVLRRTGADNLHCGIKACTSIISCVVAAGYGVYCFTTDDKQEAAAVQKAGAHGIFTNTGLI